jgi:glycerophosphoryl diester phosphodiesterase
MPRVLKIGHRGAAGHAPENTLAAVQKGIELGVDFVEIDIRRTADGALVAIHDATVNRTTNGKGNVAALTLDQLTVLETGLGQRIPTVEEVLQVARGRTGVMLELKVSGVAELTVQAVQKADFQEPVIYASFLHHELTQIRAIASGATLMVLLDRLPRSPVAYASGFHPAYVGLRHDKANRDLVDAFHGANVLVWVYTANTLKDVQHAMSIGVDGIISDFPERIPMH